MEKKIVKNKCCFENLFERVAINGSLLLRQTFVQYFTYITFSSRKCFGIIQINSQSWQLNIYNLVMLNAFCSLIMLKGSIQDVHLLYTASIAKASLGLPTIVMLTRVQTVIVVGWDYPLRLKYWPH